MPVRPKDRFEAFKRDAFTCQYCGRKTPAVVLEVDHIIPRAEGGGDGPENLVTACEQCNIGKGARLLDERAPVPGMEEQAELIRERERQLLAYNEAKAQERQRKQDNYDEAWNYWFEVWESETLPKWHTPWENSLKMYVEKLGVEDVKDAIDTTRAHFRYIVADATRYFGGVCKRKLAKVEGRDTTCTICGKYMELTFEEAAKGSSWHHTACAELREDE